MNEMHYKERNNIINFIVVDIRMSDIKFVLFNSPFPTLEPMF